MRQNIFFQSILKFKQPQIAFTLIEVLISIFILAVGIGAVLCIFPFGLQTQRNSQLTTAAIQLAQQKIEEIIAQSYEEILIGVFEEDYGFNAHFNNLRRVTQVSYFDPNQPTMPASSDLGIKKIEVKVFWRNPFLLSEKEIKLVTLIAKR